jgi:Ca2+-binding RTX toxin-like protein
MMATNAMEIRKTGFAWGQLADLQKWYGDLKRQGIVEDGKFSLTGYSLGGHLATAFNMMNPTAAKQTVTFNGAGVGKVRTGTLAQALEDFEQLRVSPHRILSRLSASEREAALYRDLRDHLADGSWTIEQARAEINLRFPASRVHAPGGQSLKVPYRSELVDALRGSLKDMKLLRDEIERLKQVSAGVLRPEQVPASQIEALDLDYRMAVRLTGKRTRSASTTANLKQGYGEKAMLAVPDGNTALGNQVDVVGATRPSMVANCQWHYGREVRVPVEDQPSYRGGIGRSVVDTSIKNGDVKLLVDNFDRKDFGDTHSLALLVDSLAVQRMLCALLPESAEDGAPALMSTVMRRASSLRTEDGSLLMGSGQGRAEGDVLENIVNALATLCLGPAEAPRLKGNPAGGTWAEVKDAEGYSGRDALHALLKRIGDSPVYQALTHASVHLRMEASDRSTGAGARKDFGAFAALFGLSPFTLYLEPALAASSSLAAALSAVWGERFEDWKQDRADRGSEAIRGISDEWIEARSEMLALLMDRNEANTQGATRSGGYRRFQDLAGGVDFHTSPPGSAAVEHEFDGARRPRRPISITHHTAFGDAGSDELTGQQRDDRLFGGDGEDRLFGLGGADHLEGGTGDDLLDGGAGADLLIGGEGRDVYRVADGDVIVDSDGLGRIVLDGRELGGVARVDGPDRWIGSHGEIYQRVGTELWIRLDGAHVKVRTPREALRPLGIELPVPPSTGAPEGGAGDDLLIKDFEMNRRVWHRLVWDMFGPYEVPTWEAPVLGREVERVDPAVLPGGLTVHRLLGTAAAMSSPSDDRLSGGAGADWIVAGGGNDDIEGGDGPDVLYGEQGHDRVNGGAQDDQIGGDNLGFLRATAANHGDDVLSGEGGDDLIFGNGGNDVVDGGEGSDVLFGDDELPFVATPHGSDLLRGGPGNDLLFGNGCADHLYGQQGDDVLAGGVGNDQLMGGDGDDQLYGDAAPAAVEKPAMRIVVRDTQFGTVLLRAPAPDELVPPRSSTDADDDVLVGGAGNDQLSGGAGDDRLEGGIGADVYCRALGEGHDVIRDSPEGSGTAEIDVLRLDATLAASRTVATRLGEDLVLRWSQSDSVLIKGQFEREGGAGIERVEFADGAVWNAQDLARRALVELAIEAAAGQGWTQGAGLPVV